jgi:hypothetical protein
MGKNFPYFEVVDTVKLAILYNILKIQGYFFNHTCLFKIGSKNAQYEVGAHFCVHNHV